MSDDRLARARHAVDVYAGAEAEGEAEPWIRDLITDLLRLIEEGGGDAMGIAILALSHWQNETGGVEYNVLNHATDDEVWTTERGVAEAFASSWIQGDPTVSCYRVVDGEIDTGNPLYEGIPAKLFLGQEGGA